MRHRAKFHQNRSIGCGDMAMFSKWRPSAILDFQKVEILSVGPLQYVILPNFLLLNDARTDRQTDGQTVDGRSTVL